MECCRIGRGRASRRWMAALAGAALMTANVATADATDLSLDRTPAAAATSPVEAAKPATARPAAKTVPAAARAPVVRRVLHTRNWRRPVHRWWRVASIQPRTIADCSTTLSCQRIYPIVHGVGF
jgi:hypothetical protein